MVSLALPAALSAVACVCTGTRGPARPWLCSSTHTMYSFGIAVCISTSTLRASVDPPVQALCTRWCTWPGRQHQSVTTWMLSCPRVPKHTLALQIILLRQLPCQPASGCTNSEPVLNQHCRSLNLANNLCQATPEQCLECWPCTMPGQIRLWGLSG